MNTLKTAIAIAWAIFWIYWLASAIGVKQGRASRRRIPLNGLSALAVILLLRVFRGGSLTVHSQLLGAIGTVLFASGIALAIWAPVHLGENWGMPMSQKAEPELVTSGPYRFLRHPIYSGLLVALLGTTLVSNLIGLVVVAVLGCYFYYSASVEEKNLGCDVPHGVSGVPGPHEDADSLRPLNPLVRSPARVSDTVAQRPRRATRRLGTIALRGGAARSSPSRGTRASRGSRAPRFACR